MVRTLITHALMVSFVMFLTLFKTYEKYCGCFCSKDIFNSKICYRYNELVIGPRVLQFKE